MPIDTTKTGAAIAAYRQRMKLSQQGLAGLMNVTHQAVSKWEKGLAVPDTETLLMLAKLFGTSMEDLLMGGLPKDPEHTAPEEAVPEEEHQPAQQTSNEAPDEPVFASELGNLDFSSIMNMLPFVSPGVADRLFRSYASSQTPDAGKLSFLAPFVSKEALADYVSSRSFKTASPEVVASLAPFLPPHAVDDMILNLDEPISPHVMQMLLPFASTKGVDQMVMGSLGIHSTNASGCQSDLSGRIQDKVHEKIRQKLETLDAIPSSAKRESPRMRIIRKAVESGNEELISELADSLGSDEQSTLLELLINAKMYSLLSELIDALDEDVQHQLVDRAFELNDLELLHIISEHI